mmetsp:Transcript_39513/g.104712  ORF Transcript_39513/g.104712 Transcript_39513/m.104712 type:complete len:81 (+) Transcript_39513:760-1002(+)
MQRWRQKHLWLQQQVSSELQQYRRHLVAYPGSQFLVRMQMVRARQPRGRGTRISYLPARSTGWAVAPDCNSYGETLLDGM